MKLVLFHHRLKITIDITHSPASFTLIYTLFISIHKKRNSTPTLNLPVPHPPPPPFPPHPLISPLLLPLLLPSLPFPLSPPQIRMRMIPLMSEEEVAKEGDRPVLEGNGPRFKSI